MNRVAGRATIAMVLVFAMLAGLCFFVFEYITKSSTWVMTSGSPHVYQKPQGMILDRDGALLLDMAEGKTYTPDDAVRKATMHWLGDRSGNVGNTLLKTYRESMVLYDRVNGVYAYGNAEGRIHLTLDADLQAAALEAMGDYKGTVAVYNYRTGELLCAVTTPTYDPDDPPDLTADQSGAYDGVYMNRFFQNSYTPGSIFKIVTLAAALETLPDARELTFSCDGVHEIGKTGDVTCEKAHGQQNLKEAFANSCNCAFAQLVEKIGKKRLQQYVELFGVVDSFSFDGFICRPGKFDLSQAGAESVAWSGIGQYEDLITPCAFLRFVGAVAAGGAGYTPHVVSQVTVGKTTTYQAQPQLGEQILSAETAATIREYMRNTVITKYGDQNFQGFTVCAKTGTAEVGADKRPNAMLTGFLLDENYPYAFIVAVEDAGYGYSVCVPIISAILARLS